jgi:hypothetical protein
MIEPGTIVELRILNVVDDPRYPPFTISGYLHAARLDDLADAALHWTSKAEGCYVTINPVDPALLARAANRVAKKPKHTTSDAEIARRIALVFDADPKRPAGVSATDAEKVLALKKINQLIAEFERRGWPAPILADSGNGYHARYRIDLPNDEASTALLKAVLQAAHEMFSDERVTIDAALFNPARIIKLYGSMARKGDSTTDRPHRSACVLSAAPVFEVVPRELLESFATEHKPEAVKPNHQPNRERFKVAVPASGQNTGISPGDDFEAKASWESILEPHDWAKAHTTKDVTYWLRPGKDRGQSATTGHNAGLHVFTSSAPPFEANGNYSKFGAYTVLNHGGDFAAAARALAKEGYGTPSPKPSGAPAAAPEETQAQTLLRLASVATLFHDPTRRAFAAIPVKGHVEVHVVQSSEFRRWLKRLFYAEQSRPPAAQAFQDALGIIEARAEEGTTEPVHVRVAGDSDRIFIDLADADWRVVEITAAGWRLMDQPPARFRRARGMLPLPMPQRGGSLEKLKDFTNCALGDFILIVAWLAAALRPTGPYPVLVLTGEQGSAKSTLARLIKRLIDPNVATVRSSPRDERDLAIAASNSWVPSFDNASVMPPWLSDALCRLSTGGGFATRELYSDDEERIFDAQRPIILNGISDFVDRADLMDRSIFVHLTPILDAARRDERQIWESFEAAAPLILGALLDAAAAGMAALPTLKGTSWPRMADFAKFGEAVSSALAYPPGEFLESYRDNRRAAIETALDDSPVAAAVRALLARTRVDGLTARAPGCWAGTASELLEELDGVVTDKVRESKRWPKSPRGMAGAVRRLAPQLRMVGVNVVFHRQGKDRTRIIEITPTESADNQPSAPSVPSAARGNKGQTADDRDGQPPATVRQPSANLPCETSLADEADEADGSLRPFSAGPREIIEL